MISALSYWAKQIKINPWMKRYVTSKQKKVENAQPGEYTQCPHQPQLMQAAPTAKPKEGASQVKTGHPTENSTIKSVDTAEKGVIARENKIALLTALHMAMSAQTVISQIILRVFAAKSREDKRTQQKQFLSPCARLNN